MKKEKRVIDPMLVSANRAVRSRRAVDFKTQKKVKKAVPNNEVVADYQKAVKAIESEQAYDDFWRDDKDGEQLDRLWRGDDHKEGLEDNFKEVLDENWFDAEDDKKRGKNKKVKKPKKAKKKWSKGKKFVVSLIVLIVLVILTVGIYAFLVLGKASNIFKGNVFDLVQSAPLKQDKNGRSNFLIFGNSEDEIGHGGAMLADSIMVLSVNQNKKDAKMFSVPRDLWIKYQEACSVGYKGKINAVYMCGLEKYNNDREKAAELFREEVKKITGVEVQYYVMTDWTAVREVTDALGGITVKPYSDDPRGLYDVATGLNLSNSNHHLNGEQALALARSRNSHGGYGLSKSNFDREKNQQLILAAMKEKALSAGVLSNPDKVFKMMDSLDKNIKTNVSMAEIRTVLDIANGMKGQIKSIQTDNLYKTGNIQGASVVIPAEATTYNPFEYEELQSYLNKKLTQEKVKKAKKANKKET